MDLDDLPFVGSVSAVAAAIADLLLTSGDTVIALGMFVVESIGLWLPLAFRLADVATWVPWLSSSAVMDVVQVLTVVFIVVYGVRLVEKWRNRS